jgi:hypothetical protein
MFQVHYPERYTDRLNPSRYVQGSNQSKTLSKNVIKHKKYNYLLELLLYTVDTQSLLNKDNYVETRTLELATELDEDTETTYTQFNYRNSFKKKLIQSGLQKKACLSSIFYLCDRFQFSLTLQDDMTNQSVCINSTYSIHHQCNFDNGWYYTEIVCKPTQTQFTFPFDTWFEDDLKQCYYIYDVLKPISKYKVTELKELAQTYNLSMNTSMKKKDIYDSLYLHLQKHKVITYSTGSIST